MLIVISSGCEKGELVNPVLTPVSSIGELYQGGITFYLDQTGQHGLIVALSDLPDAPLSCDSILGVTNTEIGEGQANTTMILIGCEGIETAASLCNDYESSGYDDWYLPSLHELGEMYKQRNNINRTAITNGGDNFIKGYYWSSSGLGSSSSTWAWNYNFGYFPNPDILTSPLGIDPLDKSLHVRAIRSF